MAFGITRGELDEWKERANRGEIALLTHLWYDKRFPEHRTVTKAACADRNKLIAWGQSYGLKPEWLHHRETFSHFDLLGAHQQEILHAEGKLGQLERFSDGASLERTRVRSRRRFK
ncbi:hypothetical protein [Shouchella shacheensis]|uniref:hypothetical protein n=1 Tax=Shouchella shacheensis TaxID=1649580 RepID=UPI00073FAEC9|nr:hypothetical protein [Shouchella shacheensis]